MHTKTLSHKTGLLVSSIKRKSTLFSSKSSVILKNTIWGVEPLVLLRIQRAVYLQETPSADNLRADKLRRNPKRGAGFNHMSAATAVRRPVSSTNKDVRMRNNTRPDNDRPGSPSSPPSSPGQSTGRPSRGCCFCCLAVKSNAGGSDKSRENKLGTMADKDEPPTLEELKLWGESFEKLMKCSGGRKVFREFLRSEYSEENMLFYLACEDLKKEDNPELMEEKARLIYEDYISILSPKEVSLDSRVREVINRNMVEPTPHTFDEAQLQIWTLMHRDSYPRFLNSHVYKRLLQQCS